MSDSEIPNSGEISPNTPAAEFAAWCEAEFERRRNSGDDFDEEHYHKAMQLVIERLQRLEDEGRA
ncbi:hypothetical protein [endosymbiont of unidentified scaly snail isolate Monju]|uniref:hypothetical protein n=1 Tax=endosymbiont of unidentified scaly snail isolate Monju TaxID=1248727 RepID=UPI0006917A11|nr:hypothetical protein [endosymbiont of unidentified scaly snail isolate Monju]